jgi:hypothetical protein
MLEPFRPLTKRLNIVTIFILLMLLPMGFGYIIVTGIDKGVSKLIK